MDIMTMNEVMAETIQNLVKVRERTMTYIVCCMRLNFKELHIIEKETSYEIHHAELGFLVSIQADIVFNNVLFKGMVITKGDIADLV